MLFNICFWLCTATWLPFLPVAQSGAAPACFTQSAPVPCLSGIINHYTPVTGFGCDSSTLQVGGLNGFAPGDKVLLIQMQVPQVDLSNTPAFGTVLNTSCIGNYEFNRILSISPGVIQLQYGLTQTYDLSGKIQLVQVPEYDSAMVCGLSCKAWDGNTGGVLALDVQNQLSFSGNIDVSGKGFRGGKVETNSVPWVFGEQQFFYPPNTTIAAEKGDGIVAIPVDFSYGRGRAGNGGGGGNAHNGGGGGGANGGSGGNGGLEIASLPASPTPNTDGIGGQKYFDNQTNKILMGGGGGGGHANDLLGTPGGKGGGIVLVLAGSIQANNFRILANGENILGGPNNNDGQGGGGGGGTIVLQTAQVSGLLNCELKGGRGGSNPYTPDFQVHGPGGGGGGGKLLLTQNQANVVPALQGGINGVSSQNLPNGAMPGEAGKWLSGFVIPEGTEKVYPVSNQLLLSVQSPLCSGIDGQIAVLHSTAQAFSLNGGAWQPDSIFANLGPGVYQIGLQFSGGCVLDTIAVLTAPPVLKDSLLSILPAACMGGGSISVTGLSGTGPFQYQLDGGAWQSSGLFSNLFAGNYTITVRDAAGCSVGSTYAVPGTPPVLDTLVSLTDASCISGGSLQVAALSGTAPFEFQLDAGPWQSSGLFADLPPGAYLLHTRDAAGCMHNSNYTIAAPPVLTDSVVLVQSPTCVSGGSIVLSAISGTMPFEFQLNGGPWQPTGMFTDLPAGPYTIVLRDGAGCTQTQNFSLPATPDLQDTLLQLEQPSCVSGGTISLSAISGTAPFDFQLNGGNWQSSGSFPHLIPGLYTLTLRDAAGCTLSRSFLLPAPPVLSDTLLEVLHATCVTGGSLSVSALSGTAPFEFQLDAGPWQSSGVFSDLIPATYTISLRDGAGCMLSMPYVISAPPVLKDTLLNLQDATCISGGLISVAALSGTAPYLFQLDNGAVQSTGVFSGLTDGSYQITVIDGAGCNQTQTYQISAPPELRDSLLQLQNETCIAGGSLNVAAISGTQPFEYQLNGGAWQSAGTFTGLPYGSYSISLRDAAGCVRTDQYSIAAPAVLSDSLLLLLHPTCIVGGSIILNALSGTPPYAYQLNGGPWQPGGAFANLAAGTYSLTLRDEAGCTKTSTYSIIDPPPVADSLLAISAAGCNEGGVLQVTAVSGTGPFQYQLDGGPWQNTGIFSDLPPGIHLLNIQDAAQCKTSGTYSIAEIPPLELRLDSLGVVDCRHSAGFLSVSASGGTGAYAFVLNPGPGTELGGQFTALSSGIYDITVSDSAGCTASIDQLEIQNKIDSVQTGETVILYEGSYYRLPDGRNTAQPGDYPFHYETVEGCDSLHIITLEVRKRHIYIPNIFHPGNDGSNRFFTVYSDESLEKVQQLMVYDRWGELIFSRNDLLPNDEENGWDGNFRGRELNPGVFVWKAKLKFKDGLMLDLSGNVTLFR